MAEPIRHDKTARQLRLLSDALDSGRLGPVRRLVNTLAPAEIGNLLESLPPGKREVVWGLVDAEDDGEVLLHVGDEVRESLIADMDPDELVAAVEDLDIDDLADLVEDLPDTVIDEVLKSMDRENRERLEQVLSYPEDSAGRLMNPDVVTVRADVNVDVVLRTTQGVGQRGERQDDECPGENAARAPRATAIEAAFGGGGEIAEADQWVPVAYFAEQAVEQHAGACRQRQPQGGGNVERE